MSDHTVTSHFDPDMVFPGHIGLIAYNHNTRSITLHCDGDTDGNHCRWSGGSFRPDRWRVKHLADAWKRHEAEVKAGKVYEHGTVGSGCLCVPCLMAERRAQSERLCTCSHTRTQHITLSGVWSCTPGCGCERFTAMPLATASGETGGAG